jgi:hypothetical protein
MCGLVLAAGLVTAGAIGAETTQPASAPATQAAIELTERISYPNAGVSFLVPKDWIRRPGQDPTELYRGERPRAGGYRITCLITCENVGESTVEQVVAKMSEQVKAHRRRIEPSRSGYVEVDGMRFYELAGTTYLGRQGEGFVWRHLKRGEICYGVIVGTPTVAGEDRADALRDFADAVCKGLRFSDLEDPNGKMYELGEPLSFGRWGFQMAVPPAWRWTTVPREDRNLLVACGLMDYRRNGALPALLVKLEYRPAGITAEEIGEGAYRAAVAGLKEGQTIEKVRSGGAKLGGEEAYELVMNVAAEPPYTEARRTAVHEDRAVTIVVRYAGLNNPRAAEMLGEIAGTYAPAEARRGGASTTGPASGAARRAVREPTTKRAD